MRLKINLSMLALFFGCSDIGKEYNWDESQPAGFSRTFGTLGYDYGWSAAHSPLDDGIIIIGKRAVEINGQSDMWVIKTDNRGMLEWDSKCFCKRQRNRERAKNSNSSVWWFI